MLDRFLSAGICVAAGVYILAGGTSWFEAVAYGMGAYFIGKGLYVWQSLGQQERSASALEFLAKQASGGEQAAGGDPDLAFVPARRPRKVWILVGIAIVAAALLVVGGVAAWSDDRDRSIPNPTGEIVIDRNGYPCEDSRIDEDGYCRP